MQENSKKILDIIKFYYSKTTRFPKFSYLSRKSELSEKEIRFCLRELEKEKLIIRKVSQYYMNDKSEETKILKFDFKSISLFKIIALIIGSISAYLSIVFSYKWLVNFLNPLNSFLFAVAVVSFLIISFEMIIILRKKKKFIMLTMFAFLWVCSTLFSMSSTMAGQIQKKIDKENMANSNSNNVLIYNQLEEEITDLKIDLKSKRIERDKLNSFLNTMEENDKEYKNINYRLYLKNKDIELLRNNISKLLSKKTELLNSGVSLQKYNDFFSWISLVFKIKGYIFEFILFLLPALFIDLISPLSFAIVLFLE